MEFRTPRFIIAGKLQRQFILLPSGQALLDVPGGNCLYAAVGVATWAADPPPAILARVGEDYPQAWLDEFDKRGLDVRGVRILPQAVDVRYFAAYNSLTDYATDNMVAHFARQGIPFPKALLGYSPPQNALDSRTHLQITSIRESDVPNEYLDARAAHLCPLDYLTHMLLPAVFHRAGLSTVTLEPSPGYMNPTFWDDIPALVSGLTAFLPSEEELCSLFKGRSQDLWEMAEALASYGCELVVIKRGEGGQYLYDSTTRTRWEVPAYPARVVNPIGAGDAFCGSFLAGYLNTFDPLQAVLHGNITASLVVEGIGPFYALDALPALVRARLEALQPAARKV